jgi:signal transduction histidine kinase/CheY-like chemotaxis protein
MSGGIQANSYQFAAFAEKEINQLRHDLIQLSANLRNLIPDNELEELKQAVNEKMNFQRVVLRTYLNSGQSEALKLVNDPVNRQSSDRINDITTNIANSINQSLRLTAQKLNQQKINIISLDYAIPHLTSFLFLVIAGFTLMKILQVFRLNNILNDAIQKEKEAQLVKDQFLANMTHELRTPLNSVLGYTKLLMKSPMRGEQQRFAKAIKTSGEVLLNVINEVLDYSKLQSGYIRFANEPFNPRDQLQNLADIVADRIKEKGLEFRLSISENLPGQLTGDAPKLVQVLLNITGNAIKFTHQGSISVTANCKERNAETAWLEFVITDTGVGIAKEKLPHIFERFYQVDGGSTRTYSGTGLGLAITQQLVKLQGGSIKVESQEGTGTQFQIRLPFKISYAVLREESKESGQVTTAPIKSAYSAKILVVDDNAMNRELAGYILEDMGFATEVVSSGFEAIEKLKQKNFDIVMMDVQMPGMDGRETTRKIRQVLKLDIPIIALSAFSQPVERQRCLEAGMNGYISKPLDENELLAMMESFCNEDSVRERDDSILDLKYLKRISNGNREFIENVILKVADTLPVEIDKLKQALSEKNREQVNGIAHDMKTTFTVLGIGQKTSEQIRYLEKWKSTPRNRNGKVSRIVGEIEQICKKVSDEIRENFDSEPATG